MRRNIHNNTNYFDDIIVNVRVRDLNAVVAQLRASGARVEEDRESIENSRFRLSDI